MANQVHSRTAATDVKPSAAELEKLSTAELYQN